MNNSVSTSDGMQIKYTENNKIIKIDTNYEGLIESFVTLFLEAINYPHHFIKYTPCKIEYNGINRRGCICDNCLSEDSLDVSLYSILKQEQKMYIIENPKYSAIEKFNLTTASLSPEVKQEIIDMLFIDCLVLNKDRHLNNIRFIINKDNSFSSFPAFDFGDSLLQSYYNIFMQGENVLKVLNKEKVKPFTTSVSKQFEMCINLGCSIQLPKIIKININRLREVYTKEIISTMVFIFRNNLKRFSDSSIIIE